MPQKKKDRRRFSRPPVLKGLKARRRGRPRSPRYTRVTRGKLRVTRLLQAALRAFFAGLRAVLRAFVADLRTDLRAVDFLAAVLRAGAFLTFRFTTLLAAIGVISFCVSISLNSPNHPGLKKSCASSKILLTRNCKLYVTTPRIRTGVLREILNFLVFRTLWLVGRIFRVRFLPILHSSDERQSATRNACASTCFVTQL